MSTAIGPWKAGEHPPPHAVVFEDDTGEPIDLTGMVARWVYQRDDEPAVERQAAIPSPLTGEAVYTWVDEDFATAGRYVAEMWVGSPDGMKFASRTFEYRVGPSIKVPTFEPPPA